MNVNKKENEVMGIKEEIDSDKLHEKGPSIGTQTNLLTPEQIEEFFKAAENGLIERLEQLFDEKPNADPNMTHFTESLLMTAIRTSQSELAEYLIDRLAINVQYEADLREFRLRTKNPIRYRKLSCRELAYNHGMMELVDLIDIISNDVTPNVKRYLINRIQTRLNVIHQTYLKRLEERNKHILFQSKKAKGKENEELPTVNITDENITQSSSSSFMLPPVTHRSYKSHIEETIQSIDTVKNKSIDETGKKTFRFSNYSLHFRLIETPDTKNKNKKQFQTSFLPTVSLFTSHSTPLITSNNTHRTISEISSRSSVQDGHVSICRSSPRIALPQIVPIENKLPMITSPKRFLSKRMNQNNIKYNYIPRREHTLYEQPKRFMPVTLKSTAIGLPSDTRIIRD